MSLFIYGKKLEQRKHIEKLFKLVESHLFKKKTYIPLNFFFHIVHVKSVAHKDIYLFRNGEPFQSI